MREDKTLFASFFLSPLSCLFPPHLLSPSLPLPSFSFSLSSLSILPRQSFLGWILVSGSLPDELSSFRGLRADNTTFFLLFLSNLREIKALEIQRELRCCESGTLDLSMVAFIFRLNQQMSTHFVFDTVGIIFHRLLSSRLRLVQHFLEFVKDSCISIKLVYFKS